MEIVGTVKHEWSKRNPSVPFPLDRSLDEPSSLFGDAWTTASQARREAWRAEAWALQSAFAANATFPAAPSIEASLVHVIPTVGGSGIVFCRRGHTNDLQASFCSTCGDVLYPRVGEDRTGQMSGGEIAGHRSQIALLNEILRP